MLRTISFISLLAIAAAGLALPASAKKIMEVPVSNPSLDWSLRVAGQRLVVEYTFKNGSDKPIELWDLMVATDGSKQILTPTAIICVQGEKPEQVLLVRGRVQPSSKVNTEFLPGLRTVAPGASVKGTAELPLPITAHHPYGQVMPLAKPPTSALLELQYFEGPIEQTSQALADGTELKRPKMRSMGIKSLRTTPKEIPSH